MKTNLFMALAFAFLMLFAACTEEKIIYVEKENGIEVLPGEGVIKISLSNDLQTKAARPIGSSEAANNVNRIKFSFIDSSGSEVSSGVEIEGAYDSRGEKLSGFGVVATDSSILILPDNNTEKEFSVKFKSLTDPGSYVIIAYGYNCVDVNDFPYTRKIGTDDSPRYFKCSDISTSAVEEIFAGYCIRKNASGENRFISINQYKMFSEEVSVTITRQVAGLMAYLCNVPASIDNQSVDKITISTPVEMDGFIFPASILEGDKEGYNGIYSSQKDIDLLTFTIKGHNDGSDSKGYYKFNSSADDGKKFLLADGMNTKDFDDLMCNDNTLFGSCFLLPYSGHMDFKGTDGYKDRTTLNLTYYTTNNSGDYEKIKTVKLKNSSSDVSEELDYDILCNHFYSVGGKTDVETTTDDDPLDISDETGYMDVFLTINDTWDNTLNLIK